MRRIWFFLCVPSLAAAQVRAPATRAMPAPDRVPRLVVFITIDQFREDYLDRFKGQLTGGLGRLVKGGAVFTNAFHDHATTETAPGHASVMSGRFPRSTGIFRNSAGVQDPLAALVGSPPNVLAPNGASPFRFRGGTLIDWIRIKDWRSRALSVSRKDRAAILPLGRAHQSVYWYDPGSGLFTTSTYYADTLPTWLAQFNARRLPASYAGKSWTLLLDPSKYPEPDSVSVESGGTDYVFPHALPADSVQVLRALIDTPFMDELTLGVATVGYRNLNLGAGEATDVLAISLSTTDAVGHRYGPESRELHDQVLRVDRMLGAFLDSLFAVRDSTRVIIALSADHGVAPVPERAGKDRPPAMRVDMSAVATKFQQALAQRGVAPNAFVFDDAILLVDRPTFARAKVNADSVIDAFAVEARAFPGVLRADRPSALAKADTVKDPIARRWLHSLPPDVPAELVVTLKPFNVWGSYAVGIHGSPHDYDAHVPVLFWGAAFKPGRYDQPARVVDMAPTLAWVTATTPTDVLDGRVLWEALR